jgi:hypothetical protein
MNNDQLLPFQRLDAYVVAKDLARKVHQGQVRDAELRARRPGGEERVSRALRRVAQ